MSVSQLQLASVRQAIAVIESGAQSYAIDGVTVTRANLAELYKREGELLGRIARQSGRGGGLFQYGRFRRVGP